VQAVFSYSLLKRQFRLRLIATPAPKPAPQAT
jgi:hypothetical protein